MKEIKKISDEQLVQEYVTISCWIDYFWNEPLSDWQEQLAEASEKLEPIMEELRYRGLTETAEKTYSEHCDMFERVKHSSNDELIFRYVDLKLLKETESMKMEKCDWSKIKKYNDELSNVENALKCRRLVLAAEEKLLIEQGRITEDRIDELKKMSTEKLELELEDGEQIMDEYYGNMFYLQKYEDDESFITAGKNISAENRIIFLILESRGNYKEFESSEISEIPLTVDNTTEEKNKEFAAVTITNNV